MASPRINPDGTISYPTLKPGSMVPTGYGRAPQDDRAAKRAARQAARLEGINKRRAKRGLEPRRARRKSVKPATTKNYTDLVQPVYAKGGVATKSAIGHNDYRKSGYTLSTVDNRKKK